MKELRKKVMNPSSVENEKQSLLDESIQAAESD